MGEPFGGSPIAPLPAEAGNETGGPALHQAAGILSHHLARLELSLSWGLETPPNTSGTTRLAAGGRRAHLECKTLSPVRKTYRDRRLTIKSTKPDTKAARPFHIRQGSKRHRCRHTSRGNIQTLSQTVYVAPVGGDIHLVHADGILVHGDGIPVRVDSLLDPYDFSLVGGNARLVGGNARLVGLDVSLVGGDSLLVIFEVGRVGCNQTVIPNQVFNGVLVFDGLSIRV